MIEDFRLRVFETVCKNGSFSAAAKLLGISQPAVSQQIAELEKALGRSLFERQAFSPDAPRPLEVELDSGRTVQIWALGDDLHLKLKTE